MADKYNVTHVDFKILSNLATIEVRIDHSLLDGTIRITKRGRGISISKRRNTLKIDILPPSIKVKKTNVTAIGGGLANTDIYSGHGNWSSYTVADNSTIMSAGSGPTIIVTMAANVLYRIYT